LTRGRAEDYNLHPLSSGTDCVPDTPEMERGRASALVPAAGETALTVEKLAKGSA